MQKLMDDVGSRPMMEQSALDTRRVLGGDTERVEVDAGGRICLPERFRKAAGIGKEVIFRGNVDRFEIWTPELHAEMETDLQTRKPQVLARL